MGELISSGTEYVGIAIPLKPRLAPWVTVVDIGDSRIQFRGAEFLFTLRHDLFIEIFEKIKLLLDGSHTVEEISSTVDASILPTTVIFLLKILRAHGILQEGDLPVPTDLTSSEIPKYQSQIQFLSHFTQKPAEALELLRQSKVAVIGKGLIKDHIQDSLGKTGFASITHLEVPQESGEKLIDSIADELEGIEFLVACDQSTGFSFFEAVNSACLKTGTRWLRVAIEGTTSILGPTIVPRYTACYICLCKRQESNLIDLEDFIAYKKEIVEKNISNDEGFSPALWDATAAQTSMEIVRTILGFVPPKTIGRFYEFNIHSPRSISHEVFRLPRCPACNIRGSKREAWDKVVSLTDE
ncbi:MAG: TOMM precursor leader peptide-binding protein [Nitrospinales bacterium]